MYKVVKRVMDFIIALCALIVLSPVMIIVAILVKATSPGPAIFVQQRVGKDGKVYDMYKFRSMCVGAEQQEGGVFCTKGDARVTKVGKFIRATSIDELPQLVNIIKGEMSFIGPRPERPEIIKQYLEEMPEFAFRTKVKAGLAGYAQVYGKYNTTPYDKLKLDLTYIENYSLWLDIKLMLLTLKILFSAESTEGVDEKQVTALKGEENRK